MTPPELFALLQQFATQDPVGASLTATVIWEAAKGALTALWKRPPQDDLFQVLWEEAVAKLDSEWWPPLRRRVRQVQGAFAAGRIADEAAFRDLLAEQDVYPEEIAPQLLSELERPLREALREQARTNPQAFQPEVLDDLARLRLLSENEIALLRGMSARLEDTEAGQRRNEQHLLEIKDGQRRNEQHLLEIKDGLAQRPEEMQPKATATPHEFNAEQSELLEAVQSTLEQAPLAIRDGRLDEAQAQVTSARHDLVVLLEALRRAQAPMEQRQPLLGLLARADLQLGTIVFERHLYRAAADLYLRAADNARAADDEDTLFLAVAQTGVAYAYGRLFRPAETQFRAALALRPDAPGVMGNQAAAQANLGELRPALETYERLVPIYRRLAEAEPAAFEPDVAMTLNNLGNVLGDLGRREEARDAYEEALEIRRRLAKTEPAAFEPYVAMTLNNLGTVLRQLGRREEARAAYVEALEIYRRLAKAEPAAFEPYVAMTLNNLGNVLDHLGRLEEARAALEEALERRRCLAEAEPAAFEPDLAMTLNNLGDELRRMGHGAEARELLKEALEIRRRLAKAEPAAFEQHVAGTLNNLGNVLREMGHGAEARKLLEEALALYESLAKTEPAAFEPALLVVQHNLALLEGGDAPPVES